MESGVAGALVPSRGTQGTEVFVVSVGSWGTVARQAVGVKGGSMEVEGKSGSVRPMTPLCFADHLPRDV